jgi:hypothetical protein
MIIENYKKNIETYLEEHFILSFPEKLRTYLKYMFLDGKNYDLYYFFCLAELHLIQHHKLI